MDNMKEERMDIFKRVFTIKDNKGEIFNFGLFIEFNLRVSGYRFKMCTNGIIIDVYNIDFVSLDNNENRIYLNRIVDVSSYDSDGDLYEGSSREELVSFSYDENDKHEIIIDDENRTFTIIK